MSAFSADDGDTSNRWKHTFVDEFLPQPNAEWQVDAEDGDGCAANRRATDEQRASPAEVPRPFVPAWMEQNNDRMGHAVDSRQIWSLSFVAPETGPGEISSGRGHFVLAGDDVLDFKSWPIVDFRHAAVLAQTVRAFPDESCQCLIHAWSLRATAGDTLQQLA
jgi:hypothetical protein